MVDTDRILETVSHYLVMLILIFIALGALRMTAGELSFWIELVFVLIIAGAYPPLVRRLGVAPESWQRTEKQ